MSDLDPKRPERSTRRLGLLAAVVVAVTAVAFGLASLAEAGSRWFGHRHGGHGFDADAAHERAEFATAWALRKLDATEDQEARIQQIVAETIDELGGMREAHEGHHEAFVELMSQETIDRERLEQLRVQQIAMAEGASSVLAAALADIAETLTPEQRAELIEHLQRHRRGRGWRH